MEKSIATRIAEAIQGPVPEWCPFTEVPKNGATVYDIPEEANKLAQDSTVPACNDGGVWFRRHNESEALNYLICESIRSKHGLNQRVHFEFYADWKYSQQGC
jgi:hypothetical protein